MSKKKLKSERQGVSESGNNVSQRERERERERKYDEEEVG